MTASTQRQWALIGAQARVEQLEQERTAIFKAFPELRRGGRASLPGSAGSADRPRRKMSAAAKKRMSAGMRRYWAKRRAQGKAKKGS